MLYKNFALTLFPVEVAESRDWEVDSEATLFAIGLDREGRGNNCF
jgi:hypothetical protein